MTITFQLYDDLHDRWLRFVFGLMFFLLGQRAWKHVFAQRGSWEPKAPMYLDCLRWAWQSIAP